MSALEPIPDQPPTIHGTAVAWEGRAVLLRGDPGSGKSDLALRLIACGCRLVADDRVVVHDGGAGNPRVSPPPILAGLIEARGVGILRLGFEQDIPLVAVVDLVAPEAVARLPDPAWTEIGGLRLPRLALAPFEASTPLKIRHLLAGHRVEDQAPDDDVHDGASRQIGCK